MHFILPNTYPYPKSYIIIFMCLKNMYNNLIIFKLSSLFNFILLLMIIKHFCVYKNTFKVEYLRSLINYLNVLIVTFN